MCRFLLTLSQSIGPKKGTRFLRTMLYGMAPKRKPWAETEAPSTEGKQGWFRGLRPYCAELSRLSLASSYTSAGAPPFMTKRSNGYRWCRWCCS
jgi:hypothetical protein